MSKQANTMITTLKIIPFLFLFILLGLLVNELFYGRPHELPSALVGEELPDFRLPHLFQSQKIMTPNDLKGRVSLLNIWATWCYACSLEHAMLLNISKKYQVPIYGMVYKDDTQKAIAWLSKRGNPYVMVANDATGDTAINLGVYGTPETFVISREGKILYRHVGAIDQKTWDEVLYPLIQKYDIAQHPAVVSNNLMRFQAFIKEIRCVVCQNQTIADSNAPLANDLRKKIYQLMLEKKSNEEIKDYLVKRYGEFILFKPRFNKLTFLLWTFPLIGFAIILFCLWRFSKSQKYSH